MPWKSRLPGLSCKPKVSKVPAVGKTVVATVIASGAPEMESAMASAEFAGGRNPARLAKFDAMGAVVGSRVRASLAFRISSMYRLTELLTGESMPMPESYENPSSDLRLRNSSTIARDWLSTESGDVTDCGWSSSGVWVAVYLLVPSVQERSLKLT